MPPLAGRRARNRRKAEAMRTLMTLAGLMLSMLWAGAAGGQGLGALGQGAPPEDLQAYAQKIQAEIAAIRGLEFKRPLKVENQSIDDFGAYLDKQLAEDIPAEIADNFDAIVRKLGLYRGPKIEDMRATMKLLLQSQAAAYYDPKTDAFYVLMEGLSGMMLGMTYSHEIYHALQDQHFDLDKYVLSASGDELNEDELLARQAVVEGEASYVMTYWLFQSMTGSPPPPQILEMTIRQQADMTTEEIRASMSDPIMMAMMPEELREAVAAMDDLPAFMMELLAGAYTKGMEFVYEIRKGGWAQVEELYREYPPRSTEHILHPEKWIARESPSRIRWAEFEGAEALKGWKALDDNTLGEIQWRVIFSEHGLRETGKSAAAGWDGDSYAVFKGEDSEEMLLLLYTCWDDEGEAAEFESAYRDLLAVKHDGVDEAFRVEREGLDVYIVEGGTAETLDAKMAFVRSAKKEKPAEDR
jgi:hypothetical protein